MDINVVVNFLMSKCDHMGPHKMDITRNGVEEYIKDSVLLEIQQKKDLVNMAMNRETEIYLFNLFVRS